MRLNNLRTTLVSVTLVSAMALVGCTSAEQKAADERTAAGEAAVASLNLTELPINEKFTDPETGDEIEIVSIAHNIPIKNKIDDETYSLLKVTVKQADEFRSYINENTFLLSSDNGASWNYPRGGAYDELVTAGFPDAEGSVTGKVTFTRWYVIAIKPDATVIKGQYHRRERKTFVGDNQTVPEFIKEFPVPRS